MKKVFTILAIYFSISAFAQEKEKDSTENDVKIYIGVGVQMQSKLNINTKLLMSNLPRVPEAMPELVFGFTNFGKKISSSIEFNGVWSPEQKGPNHTRYAMTNIRANVSYNLVNRKKVAFTTGLNLAYTYTQFDISNENNVVDFNNLNPSTNTGHIQLYNSRLYAGPSAALYLFRATNFPVRLQVAYEIGLTPGTWRSEFVNTANAVNERGRNRFLVGLVFGI